MHFSRRAIVTAAFCIGLVFAPASIPAFASATTDSLNAYWKLDETSAGTFLNSSGETNTGTGNGSGGANNTPQPSVSVPAAISFPDARSLSFDGTDDYVSMSANPFTADNFTISLWVNPTVANNGSYQGFMGREGGSWASRPPTMWVGPNNGILHYMIVSTTGTAYYDYLPNFFVNSNEWVHVTWVKNGTSSNFYRNGVLMVSNQPSPALIYRSGTDYRLGQVDNYFGGKLDDVRIYNRALAPWEIADLGAGTHPRAYWKGTNSTSFENATNWSGSYIPDLYSRIVVQPMNNRLTLTGSLQIAGIQTNTGAIAFLSGQSVTINDSGTITNYGTLGLKNTETLTSFSIPTNKGTIMMMGTGSQTGFVTGNTYNNLTLNDGLIAYVKFDETSGSRAADSSGYSSSGSLIGSPSISTVVAPTSFQNPRSLSFNGSSQYVTLSGGYGSGSEMTVSAWVRPNATTGTFEAVVSPTDSRFVHLQLHTGGNIVVYTNVGAINLPILAVTPLNTWRHIAVTSRSGNTRLYVDGALTAKDTTSFTTILGSNAVHIGNGFANGRYFSGNIDDVRIYNRALNQSEIAALSGGNEPATASGTITLNNALTVYGNLILDGKTLDVSSSNYALTVSGSWLNNGGS
ncbi:MAG: hypothetical protein JWM56_39, partial [Candidatus Peribacteria bacterium]|nr:hypothetical protein [Candidatus Peribacteria bacterium]